MNYYQALVVPTLILLAIVGGALVGWALRRWTDDREDRRLIEADIAHYWNSPSTDFIPLRDNPDPSDSAGA